MVVVRMVYQFLLTVGKTTQQYQVFFITGFIGSKKFTELNSNTAFIRLALLLLLTLSSTKFLPFSVVLSTYWTNTIHSLRTTVKTPSARAFIPSKLKPQWRPKHGNCSAKHSPSKYIPWLHGFVLRVGNNSVISENVVWFWRTKFFEYHKTAR